MTKKLSESSTLYHEGRDALASKNYVMAIEKLERSSLLVPHFKTFESLGECFLELNNYSRAIACFAAAAGLGKKQFKAYFLLAKALFAFGDKVNAKEKLEQALEINPNFVTASDLLKEISDNQEL